MNRLMFNWRNCVKMEENNGNGGEGGGEGGGGGGGGGGTGASTGSGTGGGTGGGGDNTSGGGVGGSAFAQKGGAGGQGGKGGDKGGEGVTGGVGGDKGGAGGGSAFTQKGGAGAEAGAHDKEPTREELAAMSDEDWAKGVLPDDKDAEGHDVDRTFMTQMAKVCREAGISPKQMQAMSGRFQELAKAEMQKQDAARAEQQKQLDAANAAATKAAIEKFDDRQWEDIRAAGAKYVPAGSELAKLMEGPLGSNVELLTILNVVGKSLRSATPGATGAAGSGEHDAGLAVALKTVRPGVLD